MILDYIKKKLGVIKKSKSNESTNKSSSFPSWMTRTTSDTTSVGVSTSSAGLVSCLKKTTGYRNPFSFQPKKTVSFGCTPIYEDSHCRLHGVPFKMSKSVTNGGRRCSKRLADSRSLTRLDAANQTPSTRRNRNNANKATTNGVSWMAARSGPQRYDAGNRDVEDYSTLPELYGDYSTRRGAERTRHASIGDHYSASSYDSSSDSDEETAYDEGAYLIDQTNDRRRHSSTPTYRRSVRCLTAHKNVTSIGSRKSKRVELKRQRLDDTTNTGSKKVKIDRNKSPTKRKFQLKKNSPKQRK